MRVAMIGTGYVGLVSGACFADFGHTVTCIDKAKDKIDALNAGEIPIYEPGLQQLVAKNVDEDRLYFTTEAEEAVRNADAVFIAVGTPTRRGDGHADLTYVYQAAEEIAHLIEGFTVIVTKSTVPVGTGDEVEAIIAKANPQANFAVVSNPEFLREGAAINDFKRPDRVVVGTENEEAVKVMRELYRPLYLNETPILVTKRRTSELIKYAANAFLAVKITFINEIADLCEKVGGNVQEVSRGIGLDNRIGGKFLHAGPGYGGSCFPKDTLALSKIGADADVDLKIVNSVIEVNNRRKSKMADKVIEFMGGDVSGKTIALLGLAFKPNTDDMRDAPSIDIVARLQEAGASIRAFDPASMKEAEHAMTNVLFCDGPYHAIENADAVVIVTEWDQFRALDLDRVHNLLKTPKVIDLRNIYDTDYMSERGFTYTSVGRAY
ncbi:UDP-glucose 6-dehydrogenase [Roseibium sp. TrichSKD4]|uniref:UDP-glucose dehydrogenase family protein n=1 Tax=Roseibium sp. TrichSKD4 TaxID=744980 RepID=UPI0001E565D6|nr:UDP-glucose/GDP-mannose dehydrogenase family protein [Roseibium sp. TrichSKD4]EFO34247.1 UDP-glucose 6-dehydrogenase [Roseibium sp. TrichSKD4]